MPTRPLRVAFIHPDLGIGGAERLIVDAALGLQRLGHSVDIYTSHHDVNHCFEETRDGTLKVHHIKPPFPRSIKGKLHILFAHARQLHLTTYLLQPSSPHYDVYFVDQLSTCVPILRALTKKRVVFYCHFPDKLLADGEFQKAKKVGLLKKIYRLPMDWLEEVTTGQADVILANSRFTANIFNLYFPSIHRTPRIVYPGINIAAYEVPEDVGQPDILQVTSSRPTLLSLNRFENKKNAALAIKAFALMRAKLARYKDQNRQFRLVIAGGYDPRLADNVTTLAGLVSRAEDASLTHSVIAPSSARETPPTFPSSSSSSSSDSDPDVLFLLNFTTAQRSALLTATSTLVLLYTPTNEHFGIGPVEGMLCGLPILACNSGGPTESVLDHPNAERTGWLCPPEPEVWADALLEIARLSEEERADISGRAKARARGRFGMEAMAASLEEALEEAVGMGPVNVSMTGLLAVVFLCLLIPIVLAWLFLHTR